MCRIKQSRSVWGIDDPLFEAGRMANPNLPLPSGCRNLNAAWVYGGGRNVEPTETARPQFNIWHCASPSIPTIGCPVLLAPFARGRGHHHGTLSAVLVFLLLRVPLQPQFNQLLNQPRIFQPRRRPHLGIHADRCESGHGIDLVQVNLARFGIH